MWVSESPSGESCGVVAEQVPGGVVTVVGRDDAADAPAPAPPAPAPAAGAPPVATEGDGPAIGLSGITAATPGLSGDPRFAAAGTRAEDRVDELVAVHVDRAELPQLVQVGDLRGLNERGSPAVTGAGSPRRPAGP